jgi:hypothetical protein
MEHAMILLGEYHIRLAHVSLVSPVLGSRGGYGFSVVLLGNHTLSFAFSSHDEAMGAHAALLLALENQ